MRLLLLNSYAFRDAVKAGRVAGYRAARDTTTNEMQVDCGSTYGAVTIQTFGLVPLTYTGLTAWPCVCDCGRIVSLSRVLETPDFKNKCPECGRFWPLKFTGFHKDARVKLLPLFSDRDASIFRSKETARTVYNMLLPGEDSSAAVGTAIDLLGFTGGVEFVAMSSPRFVRYEELRR